MKIRVKLLSDKATMPTRGSAAAAGLDLYSTNDHIALIEPHSSMMFFTDIAVEIPEGYFGGIYARSGLATKKGLRPANCTGVIDEDYRGNIGVCLYNDSDEIRAIEPKERIAQLIIQPYLPVELEQLEEELSETKRGNGGFGSTGTK